MRIAVCANDEKELDCFSSLITEYRLSRRGNVKCRLFHNGMDFLYDLKGGEYDLVLLDVSMPGVSGIQAARELRKLDENVKIILISSSPESAVESYNVRAYHYLLKPIDADLLFPLLDRVGNELFVQEEQGFVLKNREGVVRISFTGIEYVEVINKKVSFHLADGVIREVNGALADYEERLLSRPEFCKIHRSYLINLNYIQSIGNGYIVTKNGHSIPVSRARRKQVQDIYMQFLHQMGNTVTISGEQTAVSSGRQERSDDPWRILLVDDDPADRTFWSDILRSHGCMVRLAEKGEDALKLAADETYDCILLDVMIPGGDGFSICERLCRLTHAPVIFLSSLTESEKQLEGFAAGGIDYITKDTPAELFWAKVETRMKLSVSHRAQFCYGPLLLDLTERKVMIGGKELFLTSIEFDILRHLSEHTGQIFTPEEIFEIVWGGQSEDDGRMVQIHMSRLRQKLEKACGEHRFIETVWGQGYRFVV